MSAAVTEVAKDDITIFRNWLEKQPHLPQNTDDDVIKCFIIGAKGSIQRAKLVFDNYHNFGQLLPLLANGSDIFSEKAERFDKTTAICTLPQRTPEGYLVVVSRFLTTDPTDFDIGEYFLRQFYNLHINMMENNFGNGEFVFIIDGTGTQLSHFRTLTAALADKIMDSVVCGSPVRTKGIHLFGVPSIIETIINMFSRLMPEKMKNRMVVHQDYESLYKFVPKKILPPEFGGDGESIDTIYGKHLEKLRGYRDFFVREAAQRVEELKLRPKKDNEELPQTFRKLQVD